LPLGTLTLHEKSGSLHLLIGSVGTLLLAIFVMILLAAFDGQNFAWRIGSGIIAVWIFVGSINAIREELRGEHSLPMPFNWLIPITAQVVASFNAITALGVVNEFSCTVLCIGFVDGTYRCRNVFY
jgi:hypothetical protein